MSDKRTQVDERTIFRHLCERTDKDAGKTKGKKGINRTNRIIINWMLPFGGILFAIELSC